MVAFKTKEEYESWKALQIKEAKGDRKSQPQAPTGFEADSKSHAQTRITFSDVLPLLLLGTLAAVFVFCVMSPVVLSGR